MISSKEELIKKIIGVLGDAGHDVLNRIINSEVEDALAFERNREIKRATGALYEAKVKDEVIIQLLQKYWEIDEHQARESLRVEKTVKSFPVQAWVYLAAFQYRPL